MGMIEFVNNTNAYGLGGSYTSPSGATYYTPGASASSGRASGSGSARAAEPAALAVQPTTSSFEADMARVQPYLPQTPAAVQPRNPVDRTGAETAAFARAKDRAALSARSAVDSLHGLMASRGLSGSSIEGRETRGVVSDAIRQTDEVARDQAMESAQRAGAVDDQNYAGAITQRGQDLAAGNARVNNYSALMALLRRSQQAIY